MFTFPQEIHLIWFGLFDRWRLEKLRSHRSMNPTYQVHVWYDGTTTASTDKDLTAFCEVENITPHDISTSTFDGLTNIRLVREEIELKNYIAACDILKVALMLDYAGLYLDFDCIPIAPLAEINSELPFICALYQDSSPLRASFDVLGAAHPGLQLFRGLAKIHQLSYEILHNHSAATEDWRSAKYPDLQYAVTTSVTGNALNLVLSKLSQEHLVCITENLINCRDYFAHVGEASQRFYGYNFWEEQAPSDFFRFISKTNFSERQKSLAKELAATTDILELAQQSATLSATPTLGP